MPDDDLTQDLPDYSWSLGGGWSHHYSDFVNRTTSDKHSRLEQILRAPPPKEKEQTPRPEKERVEPPLPLSQMVEHRFDQLMVGSDGVVRRNGKARSARDRYGDELQTWSLTRSGKFGFFSPHNRWNGAIRSEVLHFEDGSTKRQRETGDFTNAYPQEHYHYRATQDRIERYMKECGIVKVEFETEECAGGQTVVHDEVIELLRNRVEL